jgi:hypothetical protein
MSMSSEREASRDDQRLEFLAILGLKPPVTVDDVKQAYLDKAKSAHPDHGGNPQEFIRLHEAFEQATEYARFKAGRMQWLSGWVEQYAEQQQLIDEVKALGGEVEVESVDWLGQTIGPDFAAVMDRLAAVRLAGPQVDDATMVQLAGKLRRQAGLHRLALVNTQVTSVGLRQLHRCESLRELDLSGTKVSAQAVESLVQDLDRLESLVLRDTGIGWAARWKLRLAHRDLDIST